MARGVKVFELLDDGVKVELFNDGKEYIASEEYVVSYKDFNSYLGEGIEKTKHKKTNLDIIKGKLGIRDGGVMKLPRGINRWEYKEGKVYLTEVIGGFGFSTIDFMLMGREEYRELDYESIYEILVEIGGYSGEIIKVKKVRRFMGMYYTHKRKEMDLEEIPYLEKYLNMRIRDRGITKERYLREGIRKYIEYMVIPEDKQVERIKKMQGGKEKIDWRIFDD